jgi:hypothetical protein
MEVVELFANLWWLWLLLGVIFAGLEIRSFLRGRKQAREAGNTNPMAGVSRRWIGYVLAGGFCWALLTLSVIYNVILLYAG